MRNTEGILATPSDVEAIADLAREAQKPQVESFHEIPYSKTKLVPVLPPKAKPVQLHTLAGLVDFINDEHPRRDATAHVVEHDSVRLFGPLEPEFRTRECYAEVSFPEDTRAFPFEQFLDLETFVIYAQARMEHTVELAEVLKVVGNVKEESVRTVEDDGVSQSVTARAGIARVEELTVPNPVRLTPYRTFREVAQPHSQFILRMQKARQGGLPTAALYESDGGAWKLDAIANIAAYLKERVEGLRVIA